MESMNEMETEIVKNSRLEPFPASKMRQRQEQNPKPIKGNLISEASHGGKGSGKDLGCRETSQPSTCEVIAPRAGAGIRCRCAPESAPCSSCRSRRWAARVVFFLNY